MPRAAARSRQPASHVEKAVADASGHGRGQGGQDRQVGAGYQSTARGGGQAVAVPAVGQQAEGHLQGKGTEIV